MAAADDEELRTQAEGCPFIRAAFWTGDDEVIAKAQEMHPPSRCSHMKQIEPTRRKR
jgi:hypothetical protein